MVKEFGGSFDIGDMVFVISGSERSLQTDCVAVVVGSTDSDPWNVKYKLHTEKNGERAA